MAIVGLGDGQALTLAWQNCPSPNNGGHGLVAGEAARQEEAMHHHTHGIVGGVVWRRSDRVMATG